MESAPDLLASPGNENPASKRPSRRHHYRQKISTLAYVKLDHTNGGIIRDLSDAGLAIQAVTPLHAYQQVHLRFDLLRPRLHLETRARVSWADSRGQAGLEFVNLPERSQRLLRQWMFTQLLSRAHRVGVAESIFTSGEPAEAAGQLSLSASAHPAIHLEPVITVPDSSDAADRHRTLPLRWLPIPVSAHSFARIVDSLILFCAVLLFTVLAMTLTEVFPGWAVALALGFVVTSIFGLLYWFLFALWIGVTPGAYLARLAGNPEATEKEEDQQRFR